MEQEASSLFYALQNIDLDLLEGKDVNMALPLLSRLLLSSTFVRRQQLLRLLYPIRKMNDVINLLLVRNIDTYNGVQAQPQTANSINSFECCCAEGRLRMVATEYLRLQEHARQATYASTAQSLKLIHSALFDNPIYLDDVSYCLSVLLMRPTSVSVINILDMCEALLYVEFGPEYIVRLVSNMPDRCQEVCQTLITHGERIDEGATFNEVSEARAKTLRRLCLINPFIAFTVRSMTLQMCKMPSLTLMITVDYLSQAMNRYNSLVASNGTDSNPDSEETPMEQDSSNSEEVAKAYEELENRYESATAFITGILLGADEDTKAWFSQYTKSAQQKRIDQGHSSILSQFRSHILAYINLLFPALTEDEDIGEHSSSEFPSIKRMSVKELNKILIRATATLRLFCALRGIGSLKLSPEESEILLRLVTCRPPANRTSVNFATTGVCTLLACSSLISNQKDEKKAGEWLKWLIRTSHYSDDQFSCYGKCSISELLLLIAIHFQNNQNSQIAELVCTTLAMKLQIKASVTKCKSLFCQEVFNEQMVTEHAVKVPVTKGLNDNIKEFLPAHCIHQLLESKAFSKHQVPIKEWIYQQICESKKPVHNILPKLIEAYVQSVIQSTPTGNNGANKPIPEEDIEKIFEKKLYCVEKKPLTNGITNGHLSSETSYQKRKNSRYKTKPEAVENGDVSMERVEVEIVDVECAQVLMLYYLVMYEDVRLRMAWEKQNLVRYNLDFMLDIPIFFLLQLARDNQNSYAAILPDLLKLVTSQYPQLCSTQHWMTIDYHHDTYYSKPNVAISNENGQSNPNIFKQLSRIENSSRPSTLVRENLMKQLTEGFENLENSFTQLVKTIGAILTLPREEIWPFVDVFMHNLSKIIKLKVNNSIEHMKLTESISKLWWKMNTIFPRKLWVMTVNALRRTQNLKNNAPEVKLIEHSWDELCSDPLITLRCDIRVFRCEHMLNIILHVLSAFLAASRRSMQDQISEKADRQKTNMNLEELRTTLILAQTSAAIQILLEFCIPNEEEQEVLNKRESNNNSLDAMNEEEKLLLKRFDSSVNCICQHLHQVFIADTNLAKLVHFQTYPSELLATTSDKIPSMHICLDFIPELLSQPDISKQVFVIELTSHLCEKYAITKSLNVAKLCFNVAYTLLQLLPSERRAMFFIPVLPALLKICKVFPILREDADIILNQINQIILSHMASTSYRLSLGSSRPFEGLEKMNWHDVKKLMSNLSLHEALYLSIQKTSLDLQSFS